MNARVCGIWALGALVLVVLWWQTEFLCDDAFIAFRYVGNAHDGQGLVWNAAPWRPVEGYSCFLWVLSLWAIWEIFGVAPPDAANPLALVFALGTLWLLARALHRMLVGRALAAVAMLAVAGSATFVTWASSGLETAMFGFFAVGWTLAVLRFARPGGLLPVAMFAALAQLTRPDGALLCLATVILFAYAFATRRATAAAWVRWASPLGLPMAHLVWRISYYGEWLPNTYYAKVVAAWPESGLRYLFCFALEHGLLVLVLAAAVCLGRRRMGQLACMPAWIAVGSWLVFVAYYSLVVGGDHFAWRPFAHLLPLLALAIVWLLQQAQLRAVAAWPLLLAFVLLAVVPGWWLELAFARVPADGFVRTSTAVPAPLRPLAAAYDRSRAWLRLRFVALPRPLHAASCAGLRQLLPERRAGQVQGLIPGTRGIYHTTAAGVVAWALADVEVLDVMGLNDWTIARSRSQPVAVQFAAEQLAAAFAAADVDRDARLGETELNSLAAQLDLPGRTGALLSPAGWGPLLLALCDQAADGLDAAEFRAAALELGDPRHMAHERVAPAQYLQALRGNVVLREGKFALDRSVPAVSDPEVIAIEAVERLSHR